MAKYEYTISKSKEVEKLLQKELKDILETIGKDVSNKVKEYIQRYWYDTYTPENYNRSWSLLKSVTYKVYDDYVEVYIDEDEFVYSLGDGEYWGRHTGFDGEKFGSGLIEFVENGKFNSGKIGSPSNPRVGDASRAIKKVNTWLKRYVRNELRRMLKMKFNIY